MKQPAVSIIIPAYNTALYIDQCLKSIQDQSLTDFEAILVNDGSTDKTESIMDRYIRHDQRFKKINQKNGGLSNARNVGFAQASGQYVMFIDSDDYVDKDLLKELYEAASRHDAEVAICNYNLHHNDTGLVGDRPEITNEGLPQKAVFSYTDIPGSSSRIAKFAVMVWNKMYKHSFLLDNNLRFNESIYRSEDMDFTTRMMVNARSIVFVNKPLINYRVAVAKSNVSTMHEFPLEVIGTTLKVVKEYLESRGVYDAFEKSYINLAVGSIMSTLYFTEEHPVHEKVYWQAHKFLKDLGADRKPKSFFYDSRHYDAVQILVSGQYADWLRARIIDLRNDRERQYISYLLREFQRKYDAEYARRVVMENSMSWRLTAPLRKTESKVRSLRRDRGK